MEKKKKKDTILIYSFKFRPNHFYNNQPFLYTYEYMVYIEIVKGKVKGYANTWASGRETSMMTGWPWGSPFCSLE